MKEGRKGKAARGGHIGGLGRGAVLEAHPAEQAIIARIDQLRREGVSVRKIIAQLTVEGVTLRSGREFTPAQINRITHRAREF
jgi:hypothetical protein